MAHSPPRFETFPAEIHLEIYKLLPKESRKACAVLTPFLREIYQQSTWDVLQLTIERLGQLPKFYAQNPNLAAYLRNLKIIALPDDLQVETWNDVLQIIRGLPKNGAFETLQLHTGMLSEFNLVEFPRLDGVKNFFVNTTEYSEEPNFHTLHTVMKSVAGNDLQRLDLYVDDSIVPERSLRVRLHSDLGRLVNDLRTSLTPNLTALSLNYETWVPEDHRQIINFPYEENSLFDALRMLSKQLASLSLTGVRYSPKLFVSEEGQKDEQPVWPNLKNYLFNPSPINAKGEWLYSFWNLDSDTPNAPERSLESLQYPTYYDDEYYYSDYNNSDFGLDPGYDRQTLEGRRFHRTRPVRSLIDEIYICASTAMAPNTPMLENWTVNAGTESGGYLRFKSIDRTLNREKSYLPPSEAIQPWLDRFGGVDQNESWRHRDVLMEVLQVSKCEEHFLRDLEIESEILLVKDSNALEIGDYWRFLDKEDRAEALRGMD